MASKGIASYMGGVNSVLTFLLLFLVSMASVPGPSFVAEAGESWPMRSKLQVDDHIIATPCGDAVCTLEFYETAYVTCESHPGQTFPAYSNCCVLKTCQSGVSSCTLHLKGDEGTVACNF